MDQTAFRGFYHETAPALRSYIARVCGSIDAADDILQEAYLRFLLKAPPDMPEAAMRGYLYRTAETLIVDRWRRAGREKKRDEAAIRQMPETPDSRLDVDIHQALGRLKPNSAPCSGLHMSRSSITAKLPRPPGSRRRVSVFCCSGPAGHLQKFLPGPAFPRRFPMRNETCPHENEVLHSCRSGEWQPDLLRHFQECADCREAERTAVWFRGTAIEEAAFPLPDPDVLWMQAHMAAFERNANRLLWISTIRRTLVFGSLSAATAAIVLEAAKAAGIAVEQWTANLFGQLRGDSARHFHADGSPGAPGAIPAGPGSGFSTVLK